MTTKIPCRAKNPDTCVYHSAERRADAALLRGDADTWLRETENMLRNSDIEEVQAFIAEHASPVSPRTTSGKPLVTHPTTFPRTVASIENGLSRARATFEERFTTAIEDINAGEPTTTYTVGGKPEHVTNEPTNALRTAYQQAAEDILELGDAPTLYERRDGDSYRVDRDALNDRIRQRRINATDDYNQDLADAYDHTQDLLLAWQTDADGAIPTKQALRKLDTAYWEEAAQQPVPAAPNVDFSRRFTDAYMEHEGIYQVYGVNQYTHNLNPYQTALVDAVDTISTYTNEVDSPDNSYISQVVTTVRGRSNLEETFEHRALDAKHAEESRAYRDVQQLLSQSRPHRDYPTGVDSYDLLESVETLFARNTKA